MARRRLEAVTVVSHVGSQILTASRSNERKQDDCPQSAIRTMRRERVVPRVANPSTGSSGTARSGEARPANPSRSLTFLAIGGW